MAQPSSSPSPYSQRVILWLAMAASIAMYFVVAQMVRPQQVQDNPGLVNILLVVAVALVGASFGVKSQFASRNLQKAGELIALTLCEAAALLGLVAWFITASPRYWWFLVLGFAADLLHFPTREG